MPMDVLMLVLSDVARDSRVLREAAALAAGGHRVHVHGRDVPAGWVPPKGVTVGSVTGGPGLRLWKRGAGPAAHEAVVTRRRGLGGTAVALGMRAGRWWLLPRHRRSVWARWERASASALRGRRFDVVHAHDFTALRLGARLAEGEGALLVYDSHEWWRGRLRVGRPEPLRRVLDRRRETRLAAGADAVLTVSEGIARRLARATGRPVTVVRNTFPVRARGTVPPALPRRPTGLVYAGRIGPGRDLRTVGAALTAARPPRPGEEPPVTVVFVGPRDEAWFRCAAARLTGVRMLPPREVDGVDGLLRGHGLAVVPLDDSCENHRLALPNKVFHAVRAGVPVVAADLPELRLLVTRYGLGELYRPGDPESLRAAVRRAVAHYPELLRAVDAARTELAWERDAAHLLTLYGLLERERRRERPRGREDGPERGQGRAARLRHRGRRGVPAGVPVAGVAGPRDGHGGDGRGNGEG